MQETSFCKSCQKDSQVNEELLPTQPPAQTAGHVSEVSLGVGASAAGPEHELHLAEVKAQNKAHSSCEKNDPKRAGNEVGPYSHSDRNKKHHHQPENKRKA